MYSELPELSMVVIVFDHHTNRGDAPFCARTRHMYHVLLKPNIEYMYPSSLYGSFSLKYMYMYVSERNSLRT